MWDGQIVMSQSRLTSLPEHNLQWTILPFGLLFMPRIASQWHWLRRCILSPHADLPPHGAHGAHAAPPALCALDATGHVGFKRCLFWVSLSFLMRNKSLLPPCVCIDQIFCSIYEILLTTGHFYSVQFAGNVAQVFQYLFIINNINHQFNQSLIPFPHAYNLLNHAQNLNSSFSLCLNY